MRRQIILAFCSILLSVAVFASENRDYLLRALDAYYHNNFSEAVISYQKFLIQDGFSTSYYSPIAHIAKASDRAAMHELYRSLTISQAESEMMRLWIRKLYRNSSNTQLKMSFFNYFFYVKEQNPSSAAISIIESAKEDVYGVYDEILSNASHRIRMEVAQEKKNNVLAGYKSVVLAFLTLDDSWADVTPARVAVVASLIQPLNESISNRDFQDSTQRILLMLNRLYALSSFREYYRRENLSYFPPLPVPVLDEAKVIPFNSFPDAMQYPNSFIVQNEQNELIGVYSNFATPYNLFRLQFEEITE